MGIQGDEGWDYSRRLYDYTLLYIISGKGRYEIDQSTYSVQDGSLLLIPPNTPTKFHIERSIDIRWIHFDFTYSSIGNRLVDDDYYDFNATQKSLIRPKLYLSNGSQLPSVVNVKNIDGMTSLILQLFDYDQSDDKYRQLLCKSVFLQILHHILSQIEEHQSSEHGSNRERYLFEMTSYMEQNYYNKLSLDEISNYAGISPNYANNIYKEKTGLTIIQYLNTLRVEKAISLLSSSDMKVEQIADYVGINDRHYFSRLVKKHSGLSPRDHRQ